MNKDTVNFKNFAKEKYLEASSLVKVPYKCRTCIYYPPIDRIYFYEFTPPCEFKKNSNVCKRWFQLLQIETNS